MLGAAPVEVGADREHDHQPLVGVGGALDQRVEERLALGLVATGDEDLLELIDARAPGARRARSRSSASAIHGAASSRPASGTARARVRESSASGRSPGRITARRQRSEPGTTPSASAGRRPARTAEDLPLPEGPTTASRVEPTRRATSSATRRSRPKKYSACAASKGARPRKGQTAGSEGSGGSSTA